MAAMTTALTEFSQNGNSRTSTTSGHTTSDPKIVIESRRVPVGNQVVAEYQLRVSHATDNSDGDQLPQKVSMTAKVAFPVTGTTTDRDAVLAIFRDIIAGDEFANSVATSEWLT